MNEKQLGEVWKQAVRTQEELRKLLDLFALWGEYPNEPVDEPALVKITLWVDGGSKGNPGEGYGSYAIFEKGELVTQETKVFGQNMTNNEAEYDALLLGLRQVHWSWNADTVALAVRTDSALVKGQTQDGWKINAPNLRSRCGKARQLLGCFASWQIIKVPKADMVAIVGH